MPASIRVLGGDGQAGVVGARLAEPIRVEVRAADGSPLSDIEVRWSVPVGSGTITPALARTDALGQAAAEWTLGVVAGEQAAGADVTGLDPVDLTARARPDRPASIAVRPEQLLLEALGDTARLGFTVSDAFGNAIDDAAPAWTSTDTTVVAVDATGLVVARGDGQARVAASLAAGEGAGPEPTDTAQVAVRLPVAAVELVPAGPVVLTGDTIPLAVVARDSSGTELHGRPVAWSSVEPAVARVDSAGRVHARAPGRATIVASVEGRADSLTLTVRPGSGIHVPALAHYDSIVTALMDEYGVPGGAVAMARDGRLVLARGYGLADTATGAVVHPASLFRIASLSKPVTALATLRLVEAGELTLDAPVLPWLEDLRPADDAEPAAGLAAVTVRQLLSHTAGWDRARGFDPAFATREVADEMGTPAPASAEDLVRFMWTRSLDHEPGSAFAYSNFGYILLARVLERVGGRDYESLVRREVLEPAGIRRMRLGRTRPGDRADDEVRYYIDGLATSVFPPHDPVPQPYGAFHLEAMDGSSGWVASVVDLVRLLSAVDGRDAVPDLIDGDTRELMLERPDVADWDGTISYHGLGWWVQPFGSGASWWSEGSFSGTAAVMVRAHNGVLWAATFNGSIPPSLLNHVLWSALYRVTGLPDHDFFDRYP